MNTNLFKQFEDIPYFSKADLRLVYNYSENALNEQIKRALKNQIIIQLKKGLYTTTLYWLKEPNKDSFLEFIASRLRYPSYLSLEYILSKNNLLTEATYPITSITIKSGRSYQNSMASFNYSSIKEGLFTGFIEKKYLKNNYYAATPAKALFDWLYLKNNMSQNLKKEIIEELRINWNNFSKSDFKEFKKYVNLSKNFKVAKIAKILKENIYVN
ncbi:MAG: hypothetical protein ACD_58C00335G0005 [uncultured bacterium]|nr:MAG: hypothetical protein ACD_58C00335G0005 [uncultured bacterium]